MSLIVEEYLRSLPYIMESKDIESDSFNNAIMIKKCIKDMEKRKLLSEFELSILSLVIDGFNFSEIARLLNVDRLRVSATFKNLSDRVAYILGGEFTDAALMERVQELEHVSVREASELVKRGLVKVDE